MEKEFSIMIVEVNMKVIGKTVKKMAKDYFFIIKIFLKEINMMVIG